MHRHILLKVPRQAARRWLQPNTLFVRTETTATAASTIKPPPPPSMIKMTHPATPLASFNKRLMDEIRFKRNKRQPHKLVKNVEQIIDEIKAQHLKFDQTTYNCILVAYKESHNVKKVLNTLEEMEEQGVPPSIDSYHIALEALGNAKETVLMKELKDAMVQQGIQPTALTYHIIIKALCQTEHLEEAFDLFQTLIAGSSTAGGVEPSPLTWTQLIQSHLRVHEVDIAYSLLQEAEAQNCLTDAVSKSRVYMDCLRMGAQADRLDMVQHCWNQTIHEQRVRPDEGVLLDTLRVAAKHGQPTLVTDVIRTLSAHGYPYKEHYFTPLMEAFLNSSHPRSKSASSNNSNTLPTRSTISSSSSTTTTTTTTTNNQQPAQEDLKQQRRDHIKDLKSAFQVLDIMHISGITPTMRTIQPILDFLRDDVTKVDEAYYVLEEMRQKDKRDIDVTAFNAVVAACAQLGDLERTVATYREAAHLGVTINVDTCNAVLDACISSRMKGMGTILIDDMKKEGIQPNVDTYTKMIELALTQKNYEDAFVYLEEMKSYDIVPPRKSYMKLAAKLGRERDPRFHMVMEELDTFGYKIHPDHVKRLWNSGSGGKNYYREKR